MGPSMSSARATPDKSDFSVHAIGTFGAAFRAGKFPLGPLRMANMAFAGFTQPAKTFVPGEPPRPMRHSTLGTT